jgi:hypothetical protein
MVAFARRIAQYSSIDSCVGLLISLLFGFDLALSVFLIAARSKFAARNHGGTFRQRSLSDKQPINICPI